MVQVIFPDSVILIGVRAFTSAAAIVVINAASYRADRIWEDQEEPPKDIATAALEASYNIMSVPSEDRVGAIFKSPGGTPLAVACGGWLFLAISHLLDAHAFYGFAVSLQSILAALVCLVLCVIQHVLLPTVIIERRVQQHLYLFSCSLVCGYMVYGLLLALDRSDAPFYFPVLGGLLVVFAQVILWFQRQRGDTFDKAGVLNPHATLYNAGGPAQVAGWILLWIGMNAVSAEPRFMYLPVYLTNRSAVAAAGVFAVLAVYWCIGYAHDEHEVDETTNRRSLRSFFFGRVLEMRVSFLLAFGLLGFTAFLPTFAEGYLLPPMLFLVVTAQGLAVGVQHVLGLREGDTSKLVKWTQVSVALYLIAAVLILFNAGIAAFALAMAGTAFMMIGWRYLMKDRKRGGYWMAEQTINREFTVYSYGTLLFPFGVFLFGWGMSIP